MRELTLELLQNWAVFRRVALLAALQVGPSLAFFEVEVLTQLPYGAELPGWGSLAMWITVLGLLVGVMGLAALADKYYVMPIYRRRQYHSSLWSKALRVSTVLGCGGLWAAGCLFLAKAWDCDVSALGADNLMAGAIFSGGVSYELFLKGLCERVERSVKASTQIEDVLKQDALGLLQLTVLASAAMGFVPITLALWAQQ